MDDRSPPAFQLVAYPEAAATVQRFIELLHRHGIRPPDGGSLDRELVSMARLAELAVNPDQSLDDPDLLRMAAGLHDLAAKVLAIEAHPSFSTLLPHLRMIAEIQVGKASFGQMRREYGGTNDLDRKMAEAYVACLVAEIGSDIELDSPTLAKGDNPDVLFTATPNAIDSAPQRVALAIKTISTRSGQTIYERIEEAAKQIDRSEADWGLIVVNTKNALDHPALWSAEFTDLDEAVDAITNQVTRLIRELESGRAPAEFERWFSRKAIPPVLFLAQSVVCLPTLAGQKTITPLKIIFAYWPTEMHDAKGQGIAESMVHVMQVVL